MTTSRRPSSFSCRQDGVILITSMIILIVMVVLGMASVRISTMELRMANNEEASIAAFQNSHALVDIVAATPTATPVTGLPGFTICTPAEAGCDLNNLLFPIGFVGTEVAAGTLNARVQRLAPALRPPPRGIESSVDKFSAAVFQVQATYDRADEGRGRSQTTEGLLVLVPN